MGMSVDPWTLGEFSAMDASVWSYQENIEDLKYRLQCATMELETYRKNRKEEQRKNEETINQLMQMVKVVTKERDEAKHQVQLILQQIGQPNFAENFDVPAQLKPGTPQLRQVRAGSGITESDNLSGTPNPHSYGSSPVESFFDPDNSPEFSSMNMADCCNIVQQQQPQQAKIPDNKVITSSARREPDPASALIDSLVPKRPLPEKGNLVQSILDAGPLLQTVMLAGPLPEWRNPPPVQQFHIPPVVMKPLELNEAVALKHNNMIHRSNGLSYVNALPLLSHPGPIGLHPAKRCMNASQSLANIPMDTGKRQRSE